METTFPEGKAKATQMKIWMWQRVYISEAWEKIEWLGKNHGPTPKVAEMLSKTQTRPF